METLICSQDVRELARDISTSLRDDRILPYIREAEDMYIRPAIGDELYIQLISDANLYPTLREGGVYTTDGGVQKYCSGLKKATAYYTYAKIVLNNQMNVTAWGVVQKNIPESTPSADSSLNKTYNDAKAMADKYLNECVSYIDQTITSDTCRGGEKKNTRTKITAIGC